MMSRFEELVAEWHDLMGIESEAYVGAGRDLTFVREDHVLDLTARYIRKLEELQQDHDARSSAFADRVLARLTAPDVDPGFLKQVCQRFIAGVGTTLRREIPDTVPRSQKVKARTLIIDWSGNPTAQWHELKLSFPLREVLLFCAEHSAGADDTLGELLADQLLDDLRDNVPNVGRLSFVSLAENRSTYHWGSAVVRVDHPAQATAQTELVAEEPNVQESPIESYLYDCERQFARDIYVHSSGPNEHLKKSNVEVTILIDDMDEPDDDDPVKSRVSGFADNASSAVAGEIVRLLNAMSASTYMGLIDAYNRRDTNLLTRRGLVFKTIKLLRKREMLKQEKECV